MPISAIAHKPHGRRVALAAPPFIMLSVRAQYYSRERGQHTSLTTGSQESRKDLSPMSWLIVYRDAERAVGPFPTEELVAAHRAASPEPDPGVVTFYLEAIPPRPGFGFVCVSEEYATGCFASSEEAAGHIDEFGDPGRPFLLEPPRVALRADYLAAGSVLLET